MSKWICLLSTSKEPWRSPYGRQQIKSPGPVGVASILAVKAAAC